MLFNSLPFVLLVFFTSLLFYRPALTNFQTHILIIASFIFYAFGQPYLLILLVISALVTTACSYLVLHHQQKSLLWAFVGVVINLAVLAFFKYNTLIAETIYSDLSAISGPGELLLTLPLPIGISFYTFQGISLVIDVLKRGHLDEEGISQSRVSFYQHTKNTLFYITFFPQLVAGPIVKAHYFYPQIKTKYFTDIDWLVVVKALITGYFLKMVIADNMQDQTFWLTYPYFLNFSSLDLMVLLFGYSMQIFADFAGYSLIAIGIAALFGYHLPQNFNFPYISQSISEFWRRWHISLSSWLREYLYIPLGGNRKGHMRLYLNLMIVMLLGGLWHGAAWSYAVWGACHGIGLAIERPFLNSWFYTSGHIMVQYIRMLLVFSFVSLAWLLFKLPDFNHVIDYINALAVNSLTPSHWNIIGIIGLYALPILAYHWLHLQRKHHSGLSQKPKLMAYALMLTAIVFNSGNTNAFIYFQF